MSRSMMSLPDNLSNTSIGLHYFVYRQLGINYVNIKRLMHNHIYFYDWNMVKVLPSLYLRHVKTMIHLKIEMFHFQEIQRIGLFKQLNCVGKYIISM
jgi:hypothetical protein